MSAPALICAGDAVIDMIPESGLYRAVPGGASFNAARAAARLGAATGFLGAMSTDALGERLANAAMEDGVDLTPCLRVEAPCPVAIAHLDGGDATYSIYQAGTAALTLTRQSLPDLPASARALLIGGFSLIEAPAAEAYEALALWRPEGVVLFLDLNIRPGLIHDPETYRARLSRIAAGADIVKASDEDLAWLGLPGPEALAELAPAALILHTRGAAGAAAIRGRQVVTTTAPAVKVRDTVGAGDVFNAGWLAFGLAREQLAPHVPEEMKAALSFAVEAASLSTQHAGAVGPKPEEMSCAP